LKKLLSLAILLVSAQLIAQNNCHSQQGTWVQKEVLEAYEKNPCSLIVRSSDGMAIKMDRYEIRCDGSLHALFGLEKDEIRGGSTTHSKLSIEENTEGQITDCSGDREVNYTLVKSVKLKKMLSNSKLCKHFINFLVI
jgi:hypothetical protein